MRLFPNKIAIRLACFAAIVQGTVASASVVWDCVKDGENGLLLYNASLHTRGLSTYWTPTTLYLAHCEKEWVVKVSDLGPVLPDSYAENLWSARDQIIHRFIADRQPFNFNDVAEFMNRQGYTASAEPLVRDSCLCELEN